MKFSKKARLFLRAFLDVLVFFTALAVSIAFILLGGVLYDALGIVIFGGIEVFFLIVLAHYDTLKKTEL